MSRQPRNKSCFDRPNLSFLILALALIASDGVMAQPQMSRTEIAAGKLIIVGGGLRPTNRGVFEKFIEFAGGRDVARVVVLPTASVSMDDSHEFRNVLGSFGVALERVQVLDVTHKNASTATHDPAILEAVRQATGVFLSGGDQRRLVRLLTERDGHDTPLLSEIRNVLQRGGVIGGTSAGASAQSATMLAVSGLPDELIDEGLDTLDYGITSDANQRGLLIARGFGFFRSGIIDQHFTQYRGRLGRLTRAVADSGVGLGLGIDENTAIVVEPLGDIQVIGAGMVTIIQAPAAGGIDGPLGYRINDVNLSLLSDGDSYDPRNQQAKVAANKPLLDPDKAEYNGNFLVNDIGAGGAVPFAIINGLAENRRAVQQAVSVKYHGDALHGYRFVFSKRSDFRAHSAFLNHNWVYSLLNIRLDISPIGAGLKPAESQIPKDLMQDADRERLAAVAFRGLLPADAAGYFRPDAPATRGDFAIAMARATHLPATNSLLKTFSDVDPDSVEGDEILRAVAAGMLAGAGAGAFQPDRSVTKSEAVVGLMRLAEKSSASVDETLRAAIEGLKKDATQGLTRRRLAILLHLILRLP